MLSPVRASLLSRFARRNLARAAVGRPPSVGGGGAAAAAFLPAASVSLLAAASDRGGASPPAGPAVRPTAARPPQSRPLSTEEEGATKKKKKKKSRPLSPAAAAGRVVLAQRGKVRKSSKPRLCAGCGTEVISGGGGGGRGTVRAAGGLDAVEEGRSKRAERKARYADALEVASGAFLCDRCRALRGSGGVWGAYDALRDVDPAVFKSQLRHIVSRRRFGLCVLVVDAVDPEFTVVKNLRDAVGSTACVLAVNKVDLVPRMTRYDLKTIQSRLAKKGVRTIEAYAVSAETGAGVVDLAEGLLSLLGGRDVFVVGAANVGKSSLVRTLSQVISESIYMRGTGRQAVRRKEAAHNLQVTISPLPGTTLQAIRVPCFPSHRHALWDTPGIINRSAIAYHLFPSHLMEALARPEPIGIPNRDNGTHVHVRAGQSVLLEAAWMEDFAEDEDRDEDDNDDDDKDDDVAEDEDRDEDDNDDDDKDDDEDDGRGPIPCVLARLDVISCEGRPSLDVRAYVPPCIAVKVVPTADAPTEATVPQAYVESVRRRMGGGSGGGGRLEGSHSQPLVPFLSPDLPGGIVRPTKEIRLNRDWIDMDIVFASLGWLCVSHRSPFELIPHCVKGSLWSKRPALYPTNLEGWLEEHGTPEHDPMPDDKEEIKWRLDAAAKKGKHLANRNRPTGGDVGDFDDSNDYW